MIRPDPCLYCAAVREFAFPVRWVLLSDVQWGVGRGLPRYLRIPVAVVPEMLSPVLAVG